MFSGAPSAGPALSAQDVRKHLVQGEQTRLLYSNVKAAAAVTVFAASALAYLQWTVISHTIVLSWLAYMLAVSAGRLLLASRYWRACFANRSRNIWRVAFSIGAGFAGAGWGAAGIVLYPDAHLANQVFLAFVLGGMMIGGGSVLAARPEAFLSFLIPTGLPTVVHFFWHNDEEHLAMGALAVIFTVAILFTTRSIYLTIHSSLNLQFENGALLNDLEGEREHVQMLNRDLELRVQERTEELRRAVTLLTDEITERKRAEQERARVERDLRHAQKLQAIGLLAGGIAHDFNNILTAIAGYTVLAQDLMPPDSEAYSHLEQVVKASMRAGDLVRGLLMFGRKGDHTPSLIPVAAVVTEALELLRASVPSAVEFRYSVDPDSGCVFADPGLIHQVVLNLCMNAYQAMAGGPGQLEVTLAPVEVDPAIHRPHAAIPAGRYIQLTVSDTGPGIPPKIADRVFEPFFTTKATGEGTGLGLSVVHGIVNGYDGFIRFENRQPTGTSFFVYLPRVPAENRLEAETLAPTPRGTGRILFVDDEEPIALLGARLLQQLGYTVTSKTSSVEALYLFTSAPGSFDLVITDFTMPHMNGGELIVRLKQVRADIPIILMSGFNDQVISVEESRKLGVGEYLKKPFSGVALAHAIRRVLLLADQRSA
jgi:signal transduction histidine kinase/ActR/RegA family two-component response regulator